LRTSLGGPAHRQRIKTSLADARGSDRSRDRGGAEFLEYATVSRSHDCERCTHQCVCHECSAYVGQRRDAADGAQVHFAGPELRDRVHSMQIVALWQP
jgi:hypothetical protein